MTNYTISAFIENAGVNFRGAGLDYKGEGKWSDDSRIDDFSTFDKSEAIDEAKREALDFDERAKLSVTEWRENAEGDIEESVVLEIKGVKQL